MVDPEVVAVAQLASRPAVQAFFVVTGFRWRRILGLLSKGAAPAGRAVNRLRPNRTTMARAKFRCGMAEFLVLVGVAMQEEGRPDPGSQIHHRRQCSRGSLESSGFFT